MKQQDIEQAAEFAERLDALCDEFAEFAERLEALCDEFAVLSKTIEALDSTADACNTDCWAFARGICKYSQNDRDNCPRYREIYTDRVGRKSTEYTLKN